MASLAPAVLAALLFNLAAALSVRAAPYQFTHVAEIDAPLTYANEQVTGPAINNFGVVAFRGVTNGVEGIYTRSPGGLVVPVATTAGGAFRAFGSAPDINDSGAVAFHAFPAAGGEGIYLAAPGGTVQTVADTSGGRFLGFGTGELPAAFPSVNNAGTVVACARLPDFRQALLRYEGGVLETPLIGTYVAAADVNDRGDIALKYGQYDVYVRDAAGAMTRIASAAGQDSLLDTVSINDRGAVALGKDFPGASIILFDGGRFTEVFGDLLTLDGGVTVNNRGELAAGAQGGGYDDYGIFTGPPSALHPVIGVGDPLFGSTIFRLSFSREGFNDAGQIAFWAQLADGRRVIALANPIPEPRSAFLAVGALAVLARRRSRRP